MNYTKVHHDTNNDDVYILKALPHGIKLIIVDESGYIKIRPLVSAERIDDDEYLIGSMRITDVPEAVMIQIILGVAVFKLSASEKVHFFNYLDEHRREG